MSFLNNPHNSTEVDLPTTEAAFDALVADVVEKYQLPNADHAAAVIGNAIKHLGRDVCVATLGYFGACCLKNLASSLAQFKSERSQHEAQVKNVVNILASDPNDAQAFDQLEKWANEGSKFAIDALRTINPTGAESASHEMDSNVTPITPNKGA